jgi:hypothetical protein
MANSDCACSTLLILYIIQCHCCADVSVLLTVLFLGGRTAWSSVVTIEGQTISARYWYDGQYVENAREDAAEVALQRLGVAPAPSNQRLYGALSP